MPQRKPRHGTLPTRPAALGGRTVDPMEEDALGENFVLSEGITDAGFGAVGEIGDEAPPVAAPSKGTRAFKLATDQDAQGRFDEPEEKTEFSAIELLEMEFNENNITKGLLDWQAASELGTEFAIDKTWPGFDEAGYGEFVEKWGIPQRDREDFLDEVTEALSAEHANSLAQGFLKRTRARDELEKLSGLARAGTLIPAVLFDAPSFITGGLLSAARFGARGGAVLTAADAMVQQGGLSALSPLQDEKDVAIAGVFGAVLGAGIGKLLGGSQSDDLISLDKSLKSATEESRKWAKEGDTPVKVVKKPRIKGPPATRNAVKDVAEAEQEAAIRAHNALRKTEEEEIVGLEDDFSPVSEADEHVLARQKSEADADEAADSAGAAAVGSGTARSETEELDLIADQVAAESGGIVTKAPVPFKGARSIPLLRSISDMMLNSKHESVRALGMKLFQEDVGTFQAAGQKVTEVEVKAVESQIANQAMMEFASQFPKYARSMGIKNTEESRLAFSELVADTIRSGKLSGNQHVDAVVARAREGLAWAIQRGKKAGTFDSGIDVNDAYLSRIYETSKWQGAMGDFGHKGLESLFRRAIVRGHAASKRAPLSRATVRTLARGMVRNIQARAEGVDSGIMHGIDLTKLERLDEMLTDVSIPRGEIDRIKEALKIRGLAESKQGAAKGRMLLDEETTIVRHNTRTGVDETLSIKDLLERDLRKLLPRYARRVGSDIAFRETLGVPSTETAIRKLSEQVRLAGGEVGEDLSRETEAGLRDMAGLLQRNVDPDNKLHRLASVARNFAYSTFGGLFGVASLAENAMFVQKAGILGTLKMLPELSRIRLSAQNGRLSNEFLDYSVGYSGQGLESVVRPTGIQGTKFDALSDHVVNIHNDALGKVERVLERTRNFIAHKSGLVPLTEWQRRSAPMLVVSEIERVLLRNGKYSTSMAKRMGQMGYDVDGLAKLQQSLRTHAIDISDQGRKVRRADMEAWAQAAPEDHARFMNAITMETNRSIIDVSAGKMPYWMTTDAGKVIGQFMSFTIHSYNTHFLRGLSMHDWQAGMGLVTSSFIAGTSWTALTYLKYHNDPKKLREELTLENMALKGFARSTAGGVPSMLTDNISMLMGGDGVFNARHSSLDTKLVSFDSLPSVALTNRAFNMATRSLEILSQQKEVTGDDIKAALRLTPLTLFPSAIKGLQSILTEQLGLRSKDRN